jgi:hypothetical protein
MTSREAVLVSESHTRISTPWMPRGYERFVVTGDARTGSTLLVQALNSSPSIRCFAEIFNVDVDFVPFGVEGYDNFDRRSRELRDRDGVAFLANRIFCEHPAGVRAVGFKLLYGQGGRSPGVREALVADEDIRVIHLRRRNVLRLLASRKIARKTNVWVDTQRGLFDRTRVRNATKHPLRTIGRVPKHVARWRRRQVLEPAAKSISVSPEELDVFATRHETRAARYTELFARHPVLTLWFEDLEQSRSAALQDVQSFLGLETAELTVTARRQNPEPLRDLISNYGDLKSQFAGTCLAACFSD